MAGQVVSSITPIVIESATSEDGFINKAFKLVVILALIVGVIMTIVGLFLLFNIWDFLGGTLGSITGFISAPFSGGSGLFGGFSVLSAGLTGLASAFAFRR